MTGTKSGNTTSASANEQQMNIRLYNGQYVDCAPKPLYKKHEVIEDEKKNPNATSKTGPKGSGNEKA